MSRTTLSPAYCALARRSLRESIPRPVKAGDMRRMRNADDSSEDDVPTPEEIDPTIHDNVCDADFVLDECVDDGQPWCDAP